MIFRRQLRSLDLRLMVPLCFAALGPAACGGGGEGATNPTGVARVEVTAPSPSLEVGAVMLLSTRYFDAAGKPLSGKAVTYSSSTDAIATVSNSGLVVGVTTGGATITATVDGVKGTATVTVIPVPVASIQLGPAQAAVRQGETLTLTAQPLDAIGRSLTGRSVTWSSADQARATVSTAGVVSGVSAGTVYIRAEAEGKRDSLSVRVKSLTAPAISSTSSAQLVPGATGVLNGTNFGTAIVDNEVLINGARATVTAASATSVSFLVPSAASLPCTATGPAAIRLIANADTAVASMSLMMATQRTLNAGQSLLLTSEADLSCNEFGGSGGRYLMTAFNYATNAGVKTSFRLLGASATAGSISSVAPVAASVGPTRTALARSRQAEDRESRHLRAHLSVMQQDRALARRLGSPRIRERIRERARAGDPRVALNAVPNPPPAVGSMLTYRMRKTFNSVSAYDTVRFRVVYVGPKLIILEDSLAPTARSMDAQLTRMGQEFDNVMYPHLLAFGDPTVVDSALDNNGHILAFFSKRVNDYVVNGQSNALLGFVTLCDFFTRDECPSSNVGEAFYAIVPDPATGFTVDLWERYMRGTLAHEAKHIDSYAWRYYLEANIDDLEEVWLEEATAQISSELWARDLYGRTQLGDITWADGPRCDYAPRSAACADPAEAIGHHFSFLYDHYEASESKSVLDAPNEAPDPVIYGASWSFVRWVTDTYAPDESAFLGALNRVQNDHGVPNLTSKSGKPFSELLGLWSLASLADNYPDATIGDSRIRIPSWNTRDMFAGMNANLVFGNGQPAYPRAWPLTVRQVSFGNFGLGSSQVTLLRGGGFICWELSGTQVSPQVLAIRADDLGPPPPQVGFAIVRIQ